MSDQAIDQPQDNYVEQLVGEGKKYASVEELAKGTLHANQFIETLKTEKQELEEKLGIQQAQTSHLETIESLLKESIQPKQEPEPVVTEPVQPKAEPEPVKEPNTIPVDVTLRMNQFAKQAVDKYGDAATAGKYLQEYIGGDKGKQALVTQLMQTDPDALLKILPDGNQSKSFSPTGSTVATPTPSDYQGMTKSQADQVRKENRRLYESPAFQTKLLKARADAKAAGINFDLT